MNTRQQGREAAFLTAVKTFDLTDLRHGCKYIDERYSVDVIQSLRVYCVFDQY